MADFNKLLVPEGQGKAVAILKAAIADFEDDFEKLEDAVAHLDELIAETERRLHAIERQPMPGGPVRSAHALTAQRHAGESHPGAALVPADLLKALQQVADESTSDVLKVAIATHIIKLQKQTR